MSRNPVRVRCAAPDPRPRLYRTDRRAVGTLVGVWPGPTWVALVEVAGHLVFRRFHECEVVRERDDRPSG